MSRNISGKTAPQFSLRSVISAHRSHSQAYPISYSPGNNRGLSSPAQLGSVHGFSGPTFRPNHASWEQSHSEPFLFCQNSRIINSAIWTHIPRLQRPWRDTLCPTLCFPKNRKRQYLKGQYCPSLLYARNPPNALQDVLQSTATFV